jgi:hypothetical protein
VDENENESQGANGRCQILQALRDTSDTDRAQTANLTQPEMTTRSNI